MFTEVCRTDQRNIIKEKYFILSLPYSTTMLQKLGGTGNIVAKLPNKYIAQH